MYDVDALVEEVIIEDTENDEQTILLGRAGYVDCLSPEQHKAACDKLAEWIFAAGLPLSTTDHPAFKK